MKLAVGFLTYNEVTAGYLTEFLQSLEAALQFWEPNDYQVYALDNSSPDQAENRLALEHFNQGRIQNYVPRRPVEYLSYGQNLGFSRAYNILIQLAQQSGAEYFLVINPDTVLAPAAIKQLVDALDNDGALGSAAPKILRWDYAQRRLTTIIDSLGLVLKPGLHFIDAGQGQEDDPAREAPDILGPSGAAGLFRLSALLAVAGPAGHYFDERFFMYKEDCDLAYRLFLAGYNSQLVPGALIYHDRTAAAVGGSWRSYLRGRSQKSRLIRAWSFKNQHLIYLKYWKNQNFVNKILVIYRSLGMLFFSLMLEQFLLKEYFFLWHDCQGLTNTK
jgi:GT2 family glycosyltransferase